MGTYQPAGFVVVQHDLCLEVATLAVLGVHELARLLVSVLDVVSTASPFPVTVRRHTYKHQVNIPNNVISSFDSLRSIVNCCISQLGTNLEKFFFRAAYLLIHWPSRWILQRLNRLLILVRLSYSL